MKNIKFIYLDLWRTLVRSHCAEPVWDLQKSIGHGVCRASGEELFTPDENFLRWCLTTDIHEPDAFIDEAVRTFGGQACDQARLHFRDILHQETVNASMYLDVHDTLIELQRRGYGLGVISNLWSFPAPYIFSDKALGQYFPRDLRIYSFEVGYRKPDPEIFLEACRKAGVRPDECLMIGDNLQADILGALNVGMQAALINREKKVAAQDVPEGVPNMFSLTDLFQYLDREEPASNTTVIIPSRDSHHGLRQ